MWPATVLDTHGRIGGFYFHFHFFDSFRDVQTARFFGFVSLFRMRTSWRFEMQSGVGALDSSTICTGHLINGITPPLDMHPLYGHVRVTGQLRLSDLDSHGPQWVTPTTCRVYASAGDSSLVFVAGARSGTCISWACPIAMILGYAAAESRTSLFRFRGLPATVHLLYPRSAHPPHFDTDSTDYKSGGSTLAMSPSAPFDNGHNTLAWKLSVSVTPTYYRIPEANRPLLLLPRSDQ